MSACTSRVKNIFSFICSILSAKSIMMYSSWGKRSICIVWSTKDTRFYVTSVDKLFWVSTVNSFIRNNAMKYHSPPIDHFVLVLSAVSVVLFHFGFYMGHPEPFVCYLLIIQITAAFFVTSSFKFVWYISNLFVQGRSCEPVCST